MSEDGVYTLVWAGIAGLNTTFALEGGSSWPVSAGLAVFAALGSIRFALLEARG